MKLDCPADMLGPYTDLEASLKEFCADGPVYYIPNRGNLGDALIREGTLRFFAQISLPCTELSKYTKLPYFKRNSLRSWVRRLGRRGVVIYGGGGGWCRLWDQAFRTVSEISRHYRVMVLPSTFEKRYAIPGVRFCRRDRFESRETMPDALFCHDMAFCLAGTYEPAHPGEGVGCFFRQDAESGRQEALPEGNVDLSLTGDHMSPVRPFFATIERFAVIHTDRLHVSIAAALLGREVHLYAGAYFKNRAIFESSLQPFFKNVHFHDASSPLPRP